MRMYLASFNCEQLEKYSKPSAYVSKWNTCYILEVSPALFALLKLQHTPDCSEDRLPNVLFIRYYGDITSHMHAETFRELNVPLS